MYTVSFCGNCVKYCPRAR